MAKNKDEVAVSAEERIDKLEKMLGDIAAKQRGMDEKVERHSANWRRIAAMYFGIA